MMLKPKLCNFPQAVDLRISKIYTNMSAQNRPFGVCHKQTDN